MTIPDYETLMLPLLRHAAKSETRVPEVATKLADEFELTPEEREQMLPSGRQRVLHNRIHWAKFYLAKAGLLDQPGRGRFVASEAGKALLARSPERIDNSLLRTIPQFAEFIDRDRTTEGVAQPQSERDATVAAETRATPEEQIPAGSGSAEQPAVFRAGYRRPVGRDGDIAALTPALPGGWAAAAMVASMA